MLESTNRRLVTLVGYPSDDRGLSGSLNEVISRPFIGGDQVVAVGTVMSRLHRGRKLIRNDLAEDPNFERLSS